MQVLQYILGNGGDKKPFAHSKLKTPRGIPSRLGAIPVPLLMLPWLPIRYPSSCHTSIVLAFTLSLDSAAAYDRSPPGRH
jgi:hypothetical protein